MGIYSPFSQPKSSAETPSTITAAAVVTTIAPASLNRGQGSYIINNSNRILWVSWGTVSPTASSPFTPVPANGGAIDFPDDFVGQVLGIWTAGPTGSCVVHEFLTA
jgi:hypothetical protein